MKNKRYLELVFIGFVNYYLKTTVKGKKAKDFFNAFSADEDGMLNTSYKKIKKSIDKLEFKKFQKDAQSFDKSLGKEKPSVWGYEKMNLFFNLSRYELNRMKETIIEVKPNVCSDLELAMIERFINTIFYHYKKIKVKEVLFQHIS